MKKYLVPLWLCISISTALASYKVDSNSLIGTWKLKTIIRITPQGREIPWCNGDSANHTGTVRIVWKKIATSSIGEKK